MRRLLVLGAAWLVCLALSSILSIGVVPADIFAYDKNIRSGTLPRAVSMGRHSLAPRSDPDEALKALTFLSTHRQLRKAGFVKVGGPDCAYYLWQDKYLVEADLSGSQKGILHLYCPFDSTDYSQQDVTPLSYSEDDGVGTLHYVSGDMEGESTLDKNKSKTGPIGRTGQWKRQFLPEEQSTGHPLKARIESLGFREVVPGSGIHQITDRQGNSLTIVYENEKIKFMGIPARGTVLDKNTLPVGCEVREHSVLGQSVPLLKIQNDFLSVDVDTLGFPVANSCQLHREASPQELGLDPAGIGAGEPVVPRSETDQVNGIPVLELQEKLRPSGDPFFGSRAGFIDATERLLDQWSLDEDYVHAQGYTHRRLAFPLLYAMALWERSGGKTNWSALEFSHNGKKYLMRGFTPIGGYQYSPFGDQIGGKIDFRITNLETGDSVSFHELVPHLIWNHGFYEGNTPYRVPPQDIIRVFFAGTPALTPGDERTIVLRSHEDVDDLPRILQENSWAGRFTVRIADPSLFPKISKNLKTNAGLKKLYPSKIAVVLDNLSIQTYRDFLRFRAAWRDSDRKGRSLLLEKVQDIRVDMSWLDRFLDLPDFDPGLIDKVTPSGFTTNQLRLMAKEKGALHRITAPLRYVRSLAANAAFRHGAFKKYPQLRELPKDTQRHSGKVMEMYYAFVTRDFRTLYNALRPAVREQTDFERVYKPLLEELWARYDALSDSDKKALETATILHDIGLYGGRRWTHNARGAQKAREILSAQGVPADMTDRVAQTIHCHGDVMDMGVDGLPHEMLRMPLSDWDLTVLISIFDSAGKNSGNTITASLLQTCLRFREVLSTHEQNNDFYRYRFQNLLCPLSVEGLQSGEFEALEQMIHRLVPAQDMASFIDNWNHRLRLHAFGLNQGVARASHENLVKLAKLISQACCAARALHPDLEEWIVDTDLDYMNLNDAQRAPYRDRLNLLLSSIPPGTTNDSVALEWQNSNHTMACGIPLRLDAANLRLVIDLKRLCPELHPPLSRQDGVDAVTAVETML